MLGSGLSQHVTRGTTSEPARLAHRPPSATSWRQAMARVSLALVVMIVLSPSMPEMGITVALGSRSALAADLPSAGSVVGVRPSMTPPATGLVLGKNWGTADRQLEINPDADREAGWAVAPPRQVVLSTWPATAQGGGDAPRTTPNADGDAHPDRHADANREAGWAVAPPRQVVLSTWPATAQGGGDAPRTTPNADGDAHPDRHADAEPRSGLGSGTAETGSPIDVDGDCTGRWGRDAHHTERLHLRCVSAPGARESDTTTASDDHARHNSRWCSC